MSCPNATAPIDISLSKITNKCDYKCAYNFNYQASSCIATNRGDYISLSYDTSTASPVIYNTMAYNVKEVRIYIPSLHAYSGSKSDGEMVIVHNCVTGAKPLLVCIPIKINNTNSTSSGLFTTIADVMSKSAPSDGESTTLPGKQYNLNDLVRKKPFFSYTATEPYQPCSASVDYVVFDPTELALDITDATITKMHSLIQDNPYDIKTGPLLFYNETGATQGNGSGTNFLQIDCQPVFESDETVDQVTYSDTGESFSAMFNNSSLFQGLIIIVVVLLIIVGLSKIIGVFTSKDFGNIPNPIPGIGKVISG